MEAETNILASTFESLKHVAH